MDERASADDDAPWAARMVANLFELPPDAALDKDLLIAVGQLLGDEQPNPLQVEVGRYLVSRTPSLKPSVRLLEFAVQGGHSLAGLALTDHLLAPLEYDETIVEFRLRFMLALARWDDLTVECDAALSREIRSVHLAFRVIVALNRLVRADHDVLPLYRRGLQAFSTVVAGSRDSSLWWARYYREIGDAISSLKAYREMIERPSAESRYRPSALRESAELALSGDRWGRDAPFLLRAMEEGVTFKLPWRAQAAMSALSHGLPSTSLDHLASLPGATAYSHVHEAVGTPETAFDYLIDEVLPRREAYRPEDTLMMVGTSLAAGGMERIFANSYRAVKASGAFERVSLALLNFEFPGPTAFYLPETGADPAEIEVLHALDVPESPISMLPLPIARRVSSAYRLIQRERPRVIHAWNDLSGIIAAFAGLLAGCPRIFVHFHHMRAINLSTDRNLIRSYPSCYRRLLERPEIELLFVADASAEDYADWWSVDRGDKFKRLYNGFTGMEVAPGARESLRRDMGFAPHAPVLGTVFRFDPVKRPWLWIDAADLVARRLPEARFVMVGGGALWEDARARVAALGLTDRFHFSGQVRNVADYLACLDVFMLTSKVEGLPNSLVEAQLAGLPVISTDVGGARETFVPGVTGRLVDVHTPEALAAAAVDCLADRTWRDAAKDKSRRMAASRFGIDRYLGSLIAMYGRA